MTQTENKKTYDRGYSAERYEGFRQAKNALSQDVFGGRCYLCGSRDGFEEFHFHHILYHPEDSSYARNSKALWTRVLRLREASAHPERFRLLCSNCHRLVTNLGSHILRRFAEQRQPVDLDILLDLAVREVNNRKEG